MPVYYNLVTRIGKLRLKQNKAGTKLEEPMQTPDTAAQFREGFQTVTTLGRILFNKSTSMLASCETLAAGKHGL